MTPDVTGDLPYVIRNDTNLYQGHLVPYLRALFFHAQNVRHQYHNFRHMTHVLWACYQACVYYSNCALTPRQMRTLLVAAMFHDFDHSGQAGNDDLNIIRSIRGLERYVVPEDKDFLPEISELIGVTEFPYETPSGELPLLGKIIRDADMMQAFSVAWIQQVIFGLAAEWGKTPLEVLRMQAGFHKGLVFHTDWARCLYPPDVVARKIQEAEELVQLLGPTPTT